MLNLKEIIETKEIKTNKHRSKFNDNVLGVYTGS